MCWNLDEEQMSRAAAFVTDCSRDKRYEDNCRSEKILTNIKNYFMIIEAEF